ncbi:hypothetical protein CORC01_01551 [Colletotrichum orchidophilum]|uniref:Uncharacterized protein n=1 Tax=Colletotrichum orchidophilum TaxID=1209926 RepID=A0A1G4BPC6_9PEZI|nr:uncharacterized protein CORC01_01551 [Colletotrichum orchidophilum]OHF03167.1 hypothetical protein CORC01_01551 [Colletotrichum orchidophilum]
MAGAWWYRGIHSRGPRSGGFDPFPIYSGDGHYCFHGASQHSIYIQKLNADYVSTSASPLFHLQVHPIIP